jgi:glycosyltransferase involved in cell wall biosynthesis
MRIIHVIGSFDPAKGGPQAVVVRLAAAQASLGHEVAIVSYSDDEINYRVAKATATIPDFARVRTFMLPMPNLRETLTGGRAARALSHLIMSVDFVHLHGVWETNLLRAAMLCRSFGIPYCVCCCGMLDVWSMKQKPLKKKIALKLGFRKMLDGAAFIQTLNQDEADLMKPLGLRPPSINIPNGIFLNEVEGSEDVRDGLGERPFVLFLSRLHYKKGLDILAGAFCRIAALFPQVDLVVAGPDGGAQESFLNEIRSMGLHNRVHLIGGIYGAAKISILRKAACFCLPSRQEGFSVAITEALACSVPVVITDACHFPEVADAGAGFICGLSPEAVASGLIAILSDPQRASKMGMAGSCLVRKNYTWPRVAAQTIRAYQSFQPSGTVELHKLHKFENKPGALEQRGDEIVTNRS